MNTIVEPKQLKGNKAVRCGRFYLSDSKTNWQTIEPTSINNLFISHNNYKLIPIEFKTDSFNNDHLLSTEAVTDNFSSFSFGHNEVLPLFKKEINIFSKYRAIVEQESSERALVYLYTSLISILNNEKSCEVFLDSIIEDFLSIDAIVHILNALSPIKDKIRNWDNFVAFSKDKLIKIEGEKNAHDLLDVIL